jgi:hypothetical protein
MVLMYIAPAGGFCDAPAAWALMGSGYLHRPARKQNVRHSLISRNRLGRTRGVFFTSILLETPISAVRRKSEDHRDTESEPDTDSGVDHGLWTGHPSIRIGIRGI